MSGDNGEQKCDSPGRKLTRLFELRRHQAFFVTDPADLIEVTPKMDVQCVPVDADNVADVAALGDEARARSFRMLLEGGQRGLYGRYRGQVVGYAWAGVCRRAHWRVNGFLRIARGEAFIHTCRVVPPFRGNNIYPALLFALCMRLLNEDRVTRVLIESRVENMASIRAIRKVGFRPAGVRTYAVICRRLIVPCGYRPEPPPGGETT